MPQRIQRKRTRGWRKPENTVLVTRPGRWANPFIGPQAVDAHRRLVELLYDGHSVAASACSGGLLINTVRFDAHFAGNDREFATYLPQSFDFESLRGVNLGCFCPLDRPCHSDTLLEICNR